MLREEHWKTVQPATLGDYVQWEDENGDMRDGYIVLAPNDSDTLEVCETEPDETLHDMVLAQENCGNLVWLEQHPDAALSGIKKRVEL